MSDVKLTDEEVDDIMQYVIGRDALSPMSNDRLMELATRWRHASSMFESPVLKSVALMARNDVLELAREIVRLRDELAQMTALYSLKLSPEDASTDDAARSMFLTREYAAWVRMNRPTCRKCGMPLRPCPLPGRGHPEYVGLFPCGQQCIAKGDGDGVESKS